MPTTYRFYRELDHSKRQIRLVRPLGQQRDNIQLKISVFSLNDNPKYTALSYCWGTEAATLPIVINGETIYIRPNLYAYLTLINKTGVSASSWLFVDAICIDQNDPNEKCHQVGLMGDVYRNAHLVEVWLGGNDAIHEEDRQLWSLFGEILQNRDQVASMSTIDLVMLALRCWEAFKWVGPLCELHYWRRLWIVQELTLARAWTFRYKTLYVDSATLLDFIDLGRRGSQILQQHQEDPASLRQSFALQDLSPPDPFVLAMTRGTEPTSDLTAISTLLKLAQTQSEQARNRGLPLHRVVTSFSSQNCFLKHDKVFGLLGMTASKLLADYHMPLHEIYLRTLIEGLLECESLQDTEPQDESQWARYDFEQVLAKALGLDPLHATTFLLTEEVYRRVGIPRHIATLNVFYKATHLEHSLTRKFSSTLPILKAVANFFDNAPFKLRCGLVRLQLRLSRALDSFLQIPGETERYATYSHCVDMVEKLYTEVHETMFPGSRTEIDRLQGQLGGLKAVSQSEAQSIVHQISCLPTTREMVKMFGYLCEQTQSKLEILTSSANADQDHDDIDSLISLVSEAKQVLFQLKNFGTMLGSDERSLLQFKNCGVTITNLLNKLVKSPLVKTKGFDGSQEETEILSDLD